MTKIFISIRKAEIYSFILVLLTNEKSAFTAIE